jgi:hypothetical protein
VLRTEGLVGVSGGVVMTCRTDRYPQSMNLHFRKPPLAITIPTHICCDVNSTGQVAKLKSFDPRYALAFESLPAHAAHFTPLCLPRAPARRSPTHFRLQQNPPKASPTPTIYTPPPALHTGFALGPPRRRQHGQGRQEQELQPQGAEGHTRL